MAPDRGGRLRLGIFQVRRFGYVIVLIGAGWLRSRSKVYSIGGDLKQKKWEMGLPDN